MKASPQNIFLIVWLFPVLAPYIVDSDVILHTSFTTKFILLFNILFFYYLALMFRQLWPSGGESYVVKSLQNLNFDKFEKRTKLALYAWLFIYIVNIIGSGGIPVVWIIMGDTRTYTDFGLPTLGGLGNLLRAFSLVSCYVLYVHSKLNKLKKRQYLWFGFGLLFSAFILETGRGNGIVLLLHPIGMHLLTVRLGIASIFKWLLVAVLVFFGTGVIQMYRYVDGAVWMEKYAESSGMGQYTGAALFFVPAITYFAVPIVNTDLNIVKAPWIDFSPNFTLQGLIPSVIRNQLFESGNYGELVNEAHNVSSFYIPLVRDFGIFGAVFFVSVFQFISYYVYANAMKGNLHYIFIWPPLFMCDALSFFSLYYTSLVVILYPTLASLILNGCKKNCSKNDNNE
ncbi:MAG: oligosaccharide repeat unit polymerase [Magnetococcales bacterium]|nr:oligosaccharide repeat unit polymerase [Magnetococcales bacterium]